MLYGREYRMPNESPIPENEISDFQKFANSKGYRPELLVDGNWGAKTNKAWEHFGTDYNASFVLKNITPKTKLNNAIANVQNVLDETQDKVQSAFMEGMKAVSEFMEQTDEPFEISITIPPMPKVQVKIKYTAKKKGAIKKTA